MDKRGALKMREIIIAAIFILLSVSAQSENFSGIKSAIEEAVTSGDMKMSIGLIADKDGDLSRKCRSRYITMLKDCIN